MNYLQDILGQMQQQRATGANPAPRWSPTGDNQDWYDMEFARQEAGTQFDRDARIRELDILQNAMQPPQRRSMSFQPSMGMGRSMGMSMGGDFQPSAERQTFANNLLRYFRPGGNRMGG